MLCPQETDHKTIDPETGRQPSETSRETKENDKRDINATTLPRPVEGILEATPRRTFSDEVEDPRVYQGPGFTGFFRQR